MAMFGRARQKLADLVADGYRGAVPVHVRTYAETLLGNRAPITERDFSPAELNTLRSIIARNAPKARPRQAALPASEFFPAVPAGPDPYDTAWDRAHPVASERARRGGGAISDYYQYGENVGDRRRPSFSEPATNAVANTLGRFVFEPDGKGGYVVLDRYDFANEAESEMAKRYKPGGQMTLGGLLRMLGDAASGDAGALGRGLLGPDDARAVRVHLPKR